MQHFSIVQTNIKSVTWAYHLEHSTQNTSNPIKAIALLQTPVDALDLRPENRK